MMQHLDEGALQGWLDRDRSGLTAGEIEAIEQHLAACAQCAARARALEDLSGRARTILSSVVPVAEPVPEYRVVVARARGRGRRPLGRARRHVAWAASVAVALGAGWMANDLYDRGVGVAPIRPETYAPPDRGEDLEPAAERPAAEPDALPPVELPVESSAPPPAEMPVEESPALPPAAPAAEPDEAPGRAAEPQPTPPAGVPDGALPSAPASEPAPPAAPFVITGRVTDEQSGAPVEDAQVWVPEQNAGVLTGADGTFVLALRDLTADSATRDVTVVVDLIGYGRASRDVDASAGGRAVADFSIRQQALALDEIVVTGRPTVPQSRALGNSVRTEAPDPARAGDVAAAAWLPAGRDAAEQAAGIELLTVPDLALIGIEVAQADGGSAVRVRQMLDGGVVLTLVERRPSVDVAAAEPSADVVSVTVERSGVVVTATAPVAADSLAALLERLR